MRSLNIALAISMPLTIGAALTAEIAQHYFTAPEPALPIIEPVPAETRACAQHKGPDDGLACLACNIYHEARSESFQGQLAVASVTIARMRDPRYPKTLCEVVWQRIPGTRTGEFTWTTLPGDKYMRDRHAADVAYAAAKLAISAAIGESTISTGVSDKALRYHALSVAPTWNHYRQVAVIGRHAFYEER